VAGASAVLRLRTAPLHHPVLAIRCNAHHSPSNNSVMVLF
jgi:hypothetical protein